MKRTNELISAIVAISNQKTLVEPYLKELHAVLSAYTDQFEILLVDDGSGDGTHEAAAEWIRHYSGLRYLRLSRSFGPETALTAGVDAAIGDFCVTLLPESDPPRLLPAVVDQCRATKSVVVGQITNADKAFGPIERVVRKALLRFCAKYLGVAVPEGMTHLVALDRQSVRQISRTRDKFRFLVSLGSYLGLKISRFPYEPKAGMKRAPAWKRYPQALQNSLDLIVVNSVRPLRIVSLLSLSLSSLNFLYIAYVIGIYLFRDHRAEGWVTTSFQSSTNFFLLFLTLSVLSEYIGRILSESKDRPAYFLVGEMSGPTQIANEEQKNVLVGSR